MLKKSNLKSTKKENTQKSTPTWSSASSLFLSLGLLPFSCSDKLLATITLKVSDKLLSDKLLSEILLSDKLLSDKILSDKLLSDKLLATITPKVSDKHSYKFLHVFAYLQE